MQWLISTHPTEFNFSKLSQAETLCRCSQHYRRPPPSSPGTTKAARPKLTRTKTTTEQGLVSWSYPLCQRPNLWPPTHLFSITIRTTVPSITFFATCSFYVEWSRKYRSSFFVPSQLSRIRRRQSSPFHAPSFYPEKHTNPTTNNGLPKSIQRQCT